MSDLRAFGIRLNVAAITNGEDVWEGTASTIPTPAAAGEQMTTKSTSTSDGPSGSGILTVKIKYLDNNGLDQSETLTMNGTTEVDTTAINIRYIQEICTASVGSNGVAVGTISIYKKGAASTVYNTISPGYNCSMNTSRMVPANNTLRIKSFSVSGADAATGQSINLLLRSTSDDAVLTSGIFHPIDSVLVYNSGIYREYFTSLTIPPFTIIKVTAYTSLVGQDVQASWEGILVPQ